MSTSNLLKKIKIYITKMYNINFGPQHPLAHSVLLHLRTEKLIEHTSTILLISFPKIPISRETLDVVEIVIDSLFTGIIFIGFCFYLRERVSSYLSPGSFKECLATLEDCGLHVKPLISSSDLSLEDTRWLEHVATSMRTDEKEVYISAFQEASNACNQLELDMDDTSLENRYRLFDAISYLADSTTLTLWDLSGVVSVHFYVLSHAIPL